MPRILQDGSARLLQDGDQRLLQGEVAGPVIFDYKLRFENHLTPIKKRGLVRLEEPLAKGERLQIIRKTPIETDFQAEPLKPFPTEQLEYALDKICYIQQEIEGHACDCRGDDYPGTPDIPTEPPGEADLPECVPFSCEAFVAAAKAAGLTSIDFREDFIANPPVLPLSGKFELHGGGGSSDVEFADSYKGATLPVQLNTSGGAEYFAFPFGSAEPNKPSLCSDYTFALGIGVNDFASGSFGPKMAFDDAEGMALMIHNGLANSSKGNLFFLRQIEYQYSEPGFNLKVDNISINYEADGGPGFQDASGSRKWGTRNWAAGANFIYFYIKIGAMTLLESTAIPGRFAHAVPLTHGVIINGTKHEMVYVKAVSGYRTPETLQPMTIEPRPKDKAYMFSGIRGILYSMVTTTPGFDEDTLYKWYQRNFEDYELPDYCEFEGAELP